MANEMIIRKMQDIDLFDLREEEVVSLQRSIVANVNIKKMKEAVDYACIDLSKVGPPKFGADLQYIARDNQERLEIICKLLQNFNRFEQDVKNYKRNKNNCNDNYEGIFEFLLTTKDLINTVVEHSEFKIKEMEEINRQVEENKSRLKGNDKLCLDRGEKYDN